MSRAKNVSDPGIVFGRSAPFKKISHRMKIKKANFSCWFRCRTKPIDSSTNVQMAIVWELSLRFSTKHSNTL